MFWSKNKNKYVYPCIHQFCYIKVGIRGIHYMDIIIAMRIKPQFAPKSITGGEYQTFQGDILNVTKCITLKALYSDKVISDKCITNPVYLAMTLIADRKSGKGK